MDSLELSTEADFLYHFQGKVSLIQLVIRWFRGENRYMNTNSKAADNSPTNPAYILKSYPALKGEVVTQRHVNTCNRFGHASHQIDGVDTGVCPRCGEVK